MALRKSTTKASKKRDDDSQSQDSSTLQGTTLDFTSVTSTSSTRFDLARQQTAALESPAAATPPSNPSVVQIIDTTAWPNPSPDPSGIAFIPGATPGTGTLLMCDSEIDETPFFRTDNLFHMSATGTFTQSVSLTSFCKEPTGIAFNTQNGHLFISDDSKKKVFEIDPNNPGVVISSFSTSGFAVDPEDVGYDPTTNHLFIMNGGGGGAAARTIFETTLDGTIVKSMLLPSVIADPEAIAYDPVKDVFYISGTFSADIFVVSGDGLTILDTITLLEDYRNPISDTRARPKGLTLAPSSDPNDDPSVMSLWVAEYGKDQFMDGRIFEIQLSGSTLPALFTTGIDDVNFNTEVVAGTYLEGSQYNALAGNDIVTLPFDAAAAAAAGYSVGKLFSGSDGHDSITGGTLDDSVSGGSGNDLILGGNGNDTLAGDGNADTLNGGAGNDALNGGSSADTLIGGLGNDTLNGGSSNDLADFSSAGGAVTVNLALGTATGEGNDSMLAVENVTGSGFSDSITGSSARNTLVGGTGDDTILGGDGNDVVTGGSGDDTILGDDGNDVVTGSSGTDQLSGGGGHDTLKWDNADFFDGGIGFDTLDAILSTADTIDLRGANFANLERIRTGSGKDIVTLSLDDVLSGTADNQFVADLASSSPDTLNIDLTGGWQSTTPNSTLGPTGVAAGISISGMTAYTFTNNVDTVTIFSNAEVVNASVIA